jgi:hypothetical protein
MSDTARILVYYWSPGDRTGDDRARQAALIGATGANAVYVPGISLDRIPRAPLHARGVRIIADWSVFVGEELRQRFPDSVPVDASGRPFERDGWYVPVCPNHPEVRRWHTEGIARLLARYGDQLFGLWLDFIRYPVRWEGAAPPLPQLCFCRHCLNLFLDEQREHYSIEETHRQAQTILSERRDEWVEWKCGRIVAFTQEVRRLITEAGLDLRLGIFSLPWRQDDFDGAIKSIASQDLARLARTVDTFSPMVYHRLCAQDVAWIADVIRDVQRVTGRAVLPIVQAMDRPGLLPAGELEAALAASLATGAEGVMIFTLDAVEETPVKVATVHRFFAQR